MGRPYLERSRRGVPAAVRFSWFSTSISKMDVASPPACNGVFTTPRFRPGAYLRRPGARRPSPGHRAHQCVPTWLPSCAIDRWKPRERPDQATRISRTPHRGLTERHPGNYDAVATPKAKKLFRLTTSCASSEETAAGTAMTRCSLCIGISTTPRCAAAPARCSARLAYWAGRLEHAPSIPDAADRQGVGVPTGASAHGRAMRRVETDRRGHSGRPFRGHPGAARPNTQVSPRA